MDKKLNIRKRTPSSRSKTLSRSNYKKRKRRQIRKAGYLLEIVAKVNKKCLERRKQGYDLLRIVVDVKPPRGRYEHGYHVIYRYYKFGRVKKVMHETLIISILTWITKGNMVAIPAHFDKVLIKNRRENINIWLERKE